MKIYDLEKSIEFIFNNKNLLEIALSHKSYSKFNNEKLEFLGDSILNFIITKNIYFIYSDFNEGEMSKVRSFLVKSNIIIKISKKLNIDKYIFINKNFLVTKSILENVFESIIGAIFLDKGLFFVEQFIINKYSKYLNLIFNYSLNVVKDSKTTLQELSQRIFFSYPIYILENIKNFDNNKRKFYIKCKLISSNYCFIKRGIAYNKKDAEKISAKKMISFIKYKKII